MFGNSSGKGRAGEKGKVKERDSTGKRSALKLSVSLLQRERVTET